MILALSVLGFLYAVWGFVNGSYLRTACPKLFINTIFLSHYSEIFVILAFGGFAIRAETNTYTRRRLIALVFFMATMWGAVPFFFPFREPAVPGLGISPWFPGVHVPGALSYFVWLALIFFFGRRVDCGWCCPCVAIRETVGRPFREATIRGEGAWRLRSVQWLAIMAHVVYLVLLFCPRSRFASDYFGWFWKLVLFGYYLSFLLVPLTGNRNFCRYLCPFGSFYGLVGTLGFFRIEADRSLCTGCGQCTSSCDMGIPVQSLVDERGEVRVLECVGCGRCVTECPAQALTMRDVRDGPSRIAKGREDRQPGDR